MSSKAVKTPTKKTVRQSGSATGKAAAKRATTASLAQDLKSLETRLKGADTKNRKALKVLEGVVDDVKASAKNANTVQKAALTRGLNRLEIRMETYVSRAATKARAGVRSELASVTNAGADVTTLEQAIRAAHERLDAAETAQSESLVRLNRHIADLATAMDHRLNGESKARKAASAALDAKIDDVRDSFEARVDQVEKDTADALAAVGDKISEFAGVLEDRAKTSDVDTAERLADLAQETQSEFNSVQTDMTSRLEALEMIASLWKPTEAPAPVAANPYLPANADDPRIDQMGDMIGSLQEELNRMHARVATLQNPTVIAAPAAPNIAAPSPVVPSNVVNIPVALTPLPDNPYAAAARALEMSGSEPPAQAISPKIPSENLDPPMPAKPSAEAHFPQEFDPSAFPVPQVPHPVQAAPPAFVPPPVPTPIPPLAPPMASSGGYSLPEAENPVAEFPASEIPVPGMVNSDPLMPAPLPVSTYDDPAYAEGDEMRATRIGGEISKRPSLPKLPISGRNLRVGAMMVGVGVVGLFAAKTILGGPDSGTLQANTDSPAFAPSEGAVQNAAFVKPPKSDSPAIAATAPQGKYAETQTPTFAGGTQDTLDAAVKSGNPIAQFQKGLVQLQAGQMEEGARLIRLAANRNQPAAQYRLAKLYESGTGIAKDPITARELIERAARGGNRIAMHDLGNYLAYGQGGLDRDVGAALEWFTKAAERGVVDSQFNVAFLREGNEGIAADIETSLFWYFIAARQGDQGAPDRIAILTEQLDPATVANTKSRADRFNPKPIDEAANGVFRNVPWAKSRTQTASADSAAKSAAKSAEILQIRDAQTILTSLGYDVGSPDGIAGSKTRAAIKSFEEVNGLPETGQVTEELLRKLEFASGA